MGRLSARLTDQEIFPTIGFSPRAESRQSVIMVEPEPQPLVSGTGSLRSWCLSSVIRSKSMRSRFSLRSLISRFWGDMIHRAGAGPSPIPQKELTAEKLSDAFKYAVSEAASKAAQKMGEQIRSENGEEKGVSSFHRHLPLMNMRSVIGSSAV